MENDKIRVRQFRDSPETNRAPPPRPTLLVDPSRHLAAPRTVASLLTHQAPGNRNIGLSDRKENFKALLFVEVCAILLYAALTVKILCWCTSIARGIRRVERAKRNGVNSVRRRETYDSSLSHLLSSLLDQAGL